MADRIRVVMVDPETNEKVELTRKENSKKEIGRCFFKETFEYKNYEIQLRMDPDKKANGELILDADIRNKTTGKLLPKDPSWHHTKPIIQGEKRVYPFRFDNLVKIYCIIETLQLETPNNATLIKQS